MAISEQDEKHLKRTIALARRGLGTVSPNPAVGAVIVRAGEVVAEGWHRRAGEQHAEAAALAKAGGLARGATLYVNLEPCCHHGRTPPCTDAIIAAGVRRVVFCTLDPNPLVNCQGAGQLLDAGIEVEQHPLQAARKLNEVYLHFIRKRRPFVHVKAGLSMDGRIATAAGQSQWITSERARRYAHGLRRRYDAIAVGIGTVLADDPRLNIRKGSRGAIHRIILDSHLRVRADARIFSTSSEGDIIIATTESADRGKAKELTERFGARFIYCDSGPDGRVDLGCLLSLLAAEQVSSLLVEGGGQVIAAFLGAGLVDKVTFVYAPIIIGGRKAVPVVSGPELGRLEDALRLRDLRAFRLGPDIALEGYPINDR